MIIDFHTHIFAKEIAQRALHKLTACGVVTAYTDGTAEGLLESTKQSAIDLSIIQPVTTKPAQDHVISLQAIACNTHEKKLYSFGGIHPDNSNFKQEILFLKNAGIKGIKIHPIFQQVPLDDIRYKRIVSYACEQDLIILTHMGLDVTYPDCDYSIPSRAIPILKELKPEKMVLAHMAGWRCWDEVEDLLGNYPTWIDTSMSHTSDTGRYSEDYKPLSNETFRKLVALVGEDHVLFGTDSPWSNQAKSVEAIKKSGLSDQAINKILGENARNLLSL